MNLHVVETAQELAREAADAFVAAARAAPERFAACLAGGSTPLAAYRLIAERRDEVDWSRCHVFFGDERRVPLDDERSNYGNARAALLEHVPVPPSHVHPLTDADQYEGLLRAFFGERPDFDLLYLGMGDDGHTASLFPGSVALREEQRWVIEPPDVVQGMRRLTLTRPALGAARRTLVLVSGTAKAPALRRIAAGEALPAGLVDGATFLVDRAAAGDLAAGDAAPGA